MTESHQGAGRVALRLGRALIDAVFFTALAFLVWADAGTRLDPQGGTRAFAGAGATIALVAAVAYLAGGLVARCSLTIIAAVLSILNYGGAFRGQGVCPSLPPTTLPSGYFPAGWFPLVLAASLLLVAAVLATTGAGWKVAQGARVSWRTATLAPIAVVILAWPLGSTAVSQALGNALTSNAAFLISSLIFAWPMLAAVTTIAGTIAPSRRPQLPRYVAGAGLALGVALEFPLVLLLAFATDFPTNRVGADARCLILVWAICIPATMAIWLAHVVSTRRSLPATQASAGRDAGIGDN